MQRRSVCNAVALTAPVFAMQSLLLDNNRLGEVAPAICQLHQLEVLVLSNNAVAHVPSTITQLTALSKLSLNVNQLTGKKYPLQLIFSFVKVYNSTICMFRTAFNKTLSTLTTG